MPDDHPNALGTIGFMVKDYANFGFDEADVVIAVGYDIVEYAPSRWNPLGDKRIIHIHARSPRSMRTTSWRWAARSIGEALDAIADAAIIHPVTAEVPPVKALLAEEWEHGASDTAFRWRRRGSCTTSAPRWAHDDIVLCDTGRPRCGWRVSTRRMSPTRASSPTGLATMAFALPVRSPPRWSTPERRVLAVMGDRAFLMSVAELETAVREHVPLVVLVWCDAGTD
jgi:acetolactate synthase-1/2/3 large subunit